MAGAVHEGKSSKSLSLRGTKAQILYVIIIILAFSLHEMGVLEGFGQRL